MGLGRLIFLNGSCCAALAILQIFPLLIALRLGEMEAASAFTAAMVLLGLLGGGFTLGFRGRKRNNSNLFLSLAPVTIFLTASIAVAAPFYFYDKELSILGALYEGISMITTNGASQYEDMAKNATSLMSWRAVSAWLGGLTAIIFVLVIFSRLNLGGARLHPKSMIGIADRDVVAQAGTAARAFAPLYVFVTIIVALCLTVLGVPIAKAIYFAMGIVSLTGLPLTQEMAIYLSILPVQLLMMTGFLLMSINWDSLYSSMSRKSYSLSHDPELRAYVVFLMTALVLVIITHVSANGFAGIWHSLFLGVSALSTSGWDNAPAAYVSLPVTMVLLMLMSVGGSLITAGGGIKQLRLRLLIVLGRRELDRLGHPNGAYPMMLGDKSITNSDMGAMWLLIILTTLTLLVATLLLGVQGIEFQTAFFLVISHLTLSAPIMPAIDPDFFGFSGLYDGELLVLSAVLLVGRLETLVLMLLLGRSLMK